MMASHRQVRRATSIRGLLILRVNNKVRVGASVSITTGGAGVFSDAQIEAAVVAFDPAMQLANFINGAGVAATGANLPPAVSLDLADCGGNIRLLASIHSMIYACQNHFVRQCFAVVKDEKVLR